MSEFSARTAQEQAYETAYTYFRYLSDRVEKAFPKASDDAKLAATVELCKVAASDFHNSQHWIDEPRNPWSKYLDRIAEIVDSAVVEQLRRE